VNIDPNTPAGSFQTLPNPNPLQPTPPTPSNWSGSDMPMRSGMLLDDGMLSDVSIFITAG